MRDRTLSALVLFALPLAACALPGTDARTAAAPPDVTGWKLSTGKAPSKAEFVAIAATCEDRGGPLEPCLTTLGLKHAP